MWSLKNEQFYWHEQTCVTQLSETWLDIWVLFSRMFTFEQMVWRMGKFWNSRWWVGIFYAFWSASWWGFRSSKLPTYPGIWPKFFKKVKSPAFCPGEAWAVLESLSTKCKLQTAADHCFHHAIRTRQKWSHWLSSNPENNGLHSVCSLHFVLSSFGMDWYISQEMCP